jgi:hypothetical protein
MCKSENSRKQIQNLITILEDIKEIHARRKDIPTKVANENKSLIDKIKNIVLYGKITLKNMSKL